MTCVYHGLTVPCVYHVYYVWTMSILTCINSIHLCSPRPQGVWGINRWLEWMNAAGFRSSLSRNLASYHGKMAQLLRNGCISKVFSMSSVLPHQNGNFFQLMDLWSLEYIVFFSHISQHVRIWIKCWEVFLFWLWRKSCNPPPACLVGPSSKMFNILFSTTFVSST